MHLSAAIIVAAGLSGYAHAYYYDDHLNSMELARRGKPPALTADEQKTFDEYKKKGWALPDGDKWTAAANKVNKEAQKGREDRKKAADKAEKTAEKERVRKSKLRRALHEDSLYRREAEAWAYADPEAWDDEYAAFDDAIYRRWEDSYNMGAQDFDY